MPVSTLTALSLKNQKQKNKFLCIATPELIEYYENFQEEKGYTKPKIEDDLFAITIPKEVIQYIKIGKPFRGLVKLVKYDFNTPEGKNLKGYYWKLDNLLIDN